MKNIHFRYIGRLLTFMLFILISTNIYNLVTIGKLVSIETVENAFPSIGVIVFSIGAILFYLIYEVKTMNDEIEERKKLNGVK